MKKLLLLLLLSTFSFSQTKTVVTGNIQDITGVAATSGYVQFDLQPQNQGVQYFVQGLGILAPQSAQCGIDGSGNLKDITLSTTCQVWGNGNISPANTTYTLQFAPGGSVTNVVSGYCVNGVSYNLNTPTFCPILSIAPQRTVVVTNPIQQNIIPGADGVFSLGASGLRYGSAYIKSLFADSISFTSSLNNVRWVGGTTYPTIASCYAALLPGETCMVPPGYIEAFTSDLTLNKDDTGFVFQGAATITQGNFRLIFSPGTTGLFLVGQSTAGGPAASTNAVKFIYTGTGVAWPIGSSSSTLAVQYPRIQNIWLDISNAGSSAFGIQAFGLGHGRFDSNFIEGKLTANTQTCFQIDDAAGGTFSGGISSDNLFINYCQTAMQLKGSTVESTFNNNIFLSLGFAGGKGLDLNGIDVASNVFHGGTISGYTTAVNFAGLANHNIVVVETDADTTDVAAAAGTFNNQVIRMDSTGHPTPIVSDLGTNNLIVNPAGKIFSGKIDFTSSGFKINAAGPSGHVPRGNGTSYIDAQLGLADLSGILATTSGGTGQNSTATYPTSGTVNTGTGTNNKLPKFTTGASGIIGDSTITDTGSAVSTPSTFEADGISSIGGAPNSVVGLWVQSPTLTGTTEYGILVQAVCSTSATVVCNAIQAQVKIASGAVTVAQANTIHVTDAANGGGGALITKLVGLEIDTLTQGGTSNFAIETGANPSSFGGKITAPSYSTTTNCSSSANPAVCGSASGGSFVIAAAATNVTVNTTAVTANSQIFVQEDESLGTKLGVTCNTGIIASPPAITARSAGTSFAVAISAGLAVNPVCFSYEIIN